MDKKAIIQHLKHNYHNFSEDCLEGLEKHCTVLVKKEKETLVREGQYSDYIYFVVEGLVRAYYIKDGRDISDWFAFEQEFICAIQSFFNGVASPHYIETLEPSILIAFKREDTLLLAEQYPEIDQMNKDVLNKTMLTLQERVTAFRFETAQQKYEHLLKLRPQIELRVPLMHITSYLGITLETLSRIRNQKRRI